METPNGKASPFLSLSTPRTAAHLGVRIKMDDNAGSREDDDVPPKAVETPKGGTPEQENDGPALEDQLTDLMCRLADQPSEMLMMLSHAQCDAWKSFMAMDIDKIAGLTHPERRGPVAISTRARSTLTQIKESINAEYELDEERAFDPEHHSGILGTGS